MQYARRLERRNARREARQVERERRQHRWIVGMEVDQVGHPVPGVIAPQTGAHGDACGAVRFLDQPFDDHQYTIKTDFHPQGNHTFSARFAGQNNSGLNDQAGYLVVFTDASGGNTTENDLYNLLGSWTWTATPNIVNQLLQGIATVKP